ncbi:MAG: APC family permease [Actinobacteria bacterium]|nr:APC family permease [Actinomycetota bacterium]MCL6094316.1 APC family permease [Actinomycetota bacterium]
MDAANAESTAPVSMKRTLTLTGVTVNAMALIAPGAFLWTTFAEQSALSAGSHSTAPAMWPGLLLALILAMFTAYSYAELARIYPGAGTGSSYYFAEAAFLDKEKKRHRRYARLAKLSFGWISHLYYWIYPGIMVAFGATLVGYIYQTITGGHALGFLPLAAIAVLFAGGVGYIAYRGITGSTNVAVIINVVQITALVAFGVFAIVFRLSHPHLAGGYAHPSGFGGVIIPHNLLSVLYQSTIAILLVVGFESATALGAEARNPERDVKRGVMLSLIIQGAICYLFEYLAANYVIGGGTISTGSGKSYVGGYAAAANASAPIGDMVTKMGNMTFGHGVGVVLALIMAATVLLALVGTTLACLNTGVRVTYAMAREKEMPSLLSFLHGKFATPYASIWVLTGISALLGIYGLKSVNTLTQITLASNTGTFLVYGMTCLVALIAFAGRADRHPIKHSVIPGLGLVMNLAEFVGVVYLAVKAGGSSSLDAYVALGIVAAWVVAGAIWVKVNPRMRGVKVLDDHSTASKVSLPA